MIEPPPPPGSTPGSPPGSQPPGPPPPGPGGPPPGGSPIDPARLESNWQAITAELDAPAPGRLERFLGALGLPRHLILVMAATPALRRSWFVASCMALVLGLISTDPAAPRDDLLTLLIIAPLVPVLGVALAYGPESDPGHEMALATPMLGLRLLATRAAVVLAFSCVGLAIASALAPGREPMAFAWLLPSLGLTSSTVALMSWLAPRRAAATVSVAWVIGAVAVQVPTEDRLAAFGAVGQATMVALTALALWLVVARRDRFDLLETGTGFGDPGPGSGGRLGSGRPRR